MYADIQELGPKQSMLSNGALLLKDVPIARTGVQSYHASEIAGAIDDDTAIDDAGMVEVVREPAEVFSKRSMKSFEGAAVVMRHPAGQVDAGNWKKLVVGHAQNIRRSGDLLIADLLIGDAGAMRAIRTGGWRGVSAGYDAEYATAGNGRLRQFNISGNHIAILSPHEEPRCGSVCSIGDSKRRGAMRDREGGRAVRQDYSESFKTSANARSEMGAAPDPLAIGGELIGEVDGPLSALILLPRPGNRVGIFRVGNITGMHTPGRAVTGTGNFTADRRQHMEAARERVRREQAAGAAMAARVRDFWSTRGGSHA
jgi:hypothetical protein